MEGVVIQGWPSLRLVFVWRTWFLDQNGPWGLSKGLALPVPVTACPACHLEAKLILKYEAKIFLTLFGAHLDKCAPAFQEPPWITSALARSRNSMQFYRIEIFFHLALKESTLRVNLAELLRYRKCQHSVPSPAFPTHLSWVVYLDTLPSPNCSLRLKGKKKYWFGTVQSKFWDFEELSLKVIFF